jgi:hypothetical protein
MIHHACLGETNRILPQKQDRTCTAFNFIEVVKRIWMTDPRMRPPQRWKSLLKTHGYSEKAIREAWKWYDFSEKKGIASF